MTQDQIARREQIVFALGVMGLKPYDQCESVWDGSMWPRMTYERLIEAAIARGLEKKTRRQLIGAARRGVATKFAMQLTRSVCETLGQREVDAELISLAKAMNVPFSSFFKTGGAA